MISARHRWELKKSALRCAAIDHTVHAFTRVRYAFPDAHPRRHGVRLIRNINYGERNVSEHRLDVYEPVTKERRPIVMYVHGGGFSMLSKDTHRVMALQFAREGHLVFNVNYRLGQKNPFPTPLEDVTLALQWVRANAASFGGDPNRLILAGESAGANLVMALSILATTSRPEPFARTVFAGGPAPLATIATYPFADMTELPRFLEHPRLPKLVKAMLFDAGSGYLGPSVYDPMSSPELASPLLLLERPIEFKRSFPPTFLSAGTRDPLFGQSRRTKEALDRLGIPCDLHVAPGQLHGYDALVWRASARANGTACTRFFARTQVQKRVPTMGESNALTNGIRVIVKAAYVVEQSSPAQQRYVFSYTVTISNVGGDEAQLRSRHWIITDGTGRVEEVRGPGVVGHQPTLKPGEHFEYTSGCVLKTPRGSMHGTYQMSRRDGTAFDAEIASFALELPYSLN